MGHGLSALAPGRRFDVVDRGRNARPTGRRARGRAAQPHHPLRLECPPAGRVAPAAVLEPHIDRTRDLEPAAVQNRLDVALWLPDEMLAKVDRMTMGASIEA